MRFQSTSEIHATPEHVSDVYADVDRWPEWTKSMTSVQRLDDGPLAVGSRVRIKQPGLPTTVYEVTEVEPGRSFTWVAHARGVRTTGIHTVEPSGEGVATMTATVEQAGPLGAVIGFVTQGLTDRYLAMEAAGLKERCEA